jgi:hypothetical protein
LQIAGFIFGKNTPVGASSSSSSDAASKEKIAMTSPVRMEMVRRRWEGAGTALLQVLAVQAAGCHEKSCSDSSCSSSSRRWG